VLLLLLHTCRETPAAAISRSRITDRWTTGAFGKGLVTLAGLVTFINKFVYASAAMRGQLVKAGLFQENICLLAYPYSCKHSQMCATTACTRHNSQVCAHSSHVITTVQPCSVCSARDAAHPMTPNLGHGGCVSLEVRLDCGALRKGVWFTAVRNCTEPPRCWPGAWMMYDVIKYFELQS
jgi:hypothetical protein